MQEYTENLKESGVHGAVLVLEPTFTADAFAAALGISASKSYVRRHLATELEALVRPARYDTGFLMPIIAVATIHSFHGISGIPSILSFFFCIEPSNLEGIDML